MKTDKKLLIAGLSLTFFLFLQGCGENSSSAIPGGENSSSAIPGGENSSSAIPSNNTTTDVSIPTTYITDTGRLLGSQCAQCHGTNGVSSNEWDSIAGEDDLLDEIYQDEEPIMNAQAHGYTQEEILLIGNWLKTLKSND